MDADVRAVPDNLALLGEVVPSRAVFAAWQEELLPALALCASPERAVLGFARLFRQAADATALQMQLYRDPWLTQSVATLFAGSQFLSELLLQHPRYLGWLSTLPNLAREHDADDFRNAALGAVISDSDGDSALQALLRWQRRELLRIGLSDLLQWIDLPAVTRQLSHLADAVVAACLGLAGEDAPDSGDLVVLALGKLGGAELNYSSDIDLVLVSGKDPGGHIRRGRRLIELLSRPTPEGFLYRVDMRLRPWGQSGPLVASAEGYLAYLHRDARLWERQALLKARAIAGDVDLGQDILAQAADVMVCPDPQAVRADVRGMKERIEAGLRKRGQEWGEVKLGRGSIRDIEFVTQYLQLIHCEAHPTILSANTLTALDRLLECGLIPVADYRVLTEGYAFLRPVEHYLQLMHYRQTHALPVDRQEIDYLARRLGFSEKGAGSRFLARYEQQSATIRAVYDRYMEIKGDTMQVAQPQSVGNDVGAHVARMAPSYSETFDQETIQYHAAMAHRLDREHLVEVDAALQPDGAWRVTVVAFDYPGELSLICGLLFAYGLDINQGQVFSYETELGDGGTRRGSLPGKIVDVFHVTPGDGVAISDGLWADYCADLAGLLREMAAGRGNEAQGDLAERVARAMLRGDGASENLPLIDVTIENEADGRYTVLYIDSPDTIGFLYEFTNALALTDTNVARVTVDSVGDRARDIFYLTDQNGRRIEDPARLRELRAGAVLVKHFTHLLPQSPNPEAALVNFRGFLAQLFRQPDWPDEIATLTRPEVLRVLARLLGASDFLWEDFLRLQYRNLFPIVRDVAGLAQPKSQDELRDELAAELAVAESVDERRRILNAFKDRETFRIDLRHIQGCIPDFGDFAAELTAVAEVVVDAALRICVEQVQAIHGEPRLSEGGLCPMVVCALGKCGGRELGFASDIELMFIYTGRGSTVGPDVVSTAEFYEAVVAEFLKLIRARREGIFEIDLRLRPYGSAGSLAVSLDSFRRYFSPGGAAWPYERQALVRLRSIGGDADLGAEVVALRDAYVYGEQGFDVAAMRAMRERQLRYLVTPGTLNAKYSPGGLVDAEYLVQGLQIRYGEAHPAVRQTNTRAGIRALAEAGLIRAEDAAALRESYIFWRHVIDALRMVRGNARDLTVPPADSDAFGFLARRLDYDTDLDRLRDDLESHARRIQELGRLLGEA